MSTLNFPVVICSERGLVPTHHASQDHQGPPFLIANGAGCFSILFVSRFYMFSFSLMQSTFNLRLIYRPVHKMGLLHTYEIQSESHPHSHFSLFPHLSITFPVALWFEWTEEVVVTKRIPCWYYQLQLTLMMFWTDSKTERRIQSPRSPKRILS